MLQHIRFGLAAIFSVLLADCPPEPIVDTSRQYQENAGKFVQEPAASSIFPTDGIKFYPLEIGGGTAVVTGGSRTWGEMGSRLKGVLPKSFFWRKKIVPKCKAIC